jgi:ketosteroid isomerase-like protein
MDDTQRLIAREDIKSLMARRVRCIDEKNWAGFADCYAEDAVSYSLKSAPGGKVVGNRLIAEGVAKALQGVTTVHQLHTPEIEFVADDAATGIWPLNDILSWEKDGRRNWMRAYGHYRQTYKKIGGRWLISEHHLTRLLVEQGSEALA